MHPTAIIDPQAELDSSVEVGPYCVVDANVRVAANCRLYHGVYLTGWTQVEADCELHPGVIVGHTPQDTKYGGERTYCRIGRGTILREYVTVHRGTIPESETVVGERCFLLAGSHVGHNCQVGNDVTMINNALLAGHVHVGDRVTIGGAAAVHQFVRIGELAMIAGLGHIGKDVVPFGLTDTSGRIAGVNRIGLRRAGLPREHVLEIREAFRILFRNELPFSESVSQLENVMANPPGLRFLSFVRAETTRGIAGRSRTRSNGPESKEDVDLGEYGE